MAINYDLILKYLVKEEKEKELSFTNQKNFMTYSDKFPNEFKNIFSIVFINRLFSGHLFYNK